MWKIFFKYTDGSKLTVTGKQKDIPLYLAEKYNKQYGIYAISAGYQKYPLKSNKKISLSEKIAQLIDEREEE